ncbi:hypothetical protein FOZ61_001292 [Perkinsus olseni]|uniref:Uncharacterized protein n=1 Tax=Perkinsus olseni TaxID=32597 RepID=A0A7J6LNZ4_PEROL|nr:hypothetical protein FOL46_005877 [Perkinsus olseni]KAF4663880.1 hypothetical protein FOZ61_001292 [Perkinsus olseni]
MRLLSQLLFSLTATLARGNGGRPLEWLFSTNINTGDRYYIEPKERSSMLRTGPSATVDNGFQCIPATQYATVLNVFSVRNVRINHVKAETQRQTWFSARLVTNEGRECFISLDPSDPEVAADLKEMYQRVLDKDGTYSGENTGFMKLEIDVKDGMVERVNAEPLNDVAKTMDKLTYYGVGDVLSVIVESSTAPLMTYRLILEPEDSGVGLRGRVVGNSNLRDWDCRPPTPGEIERGHGRSPHVARRKAPFLD